MGLILDTERRGETIEDILRHARAVHGEVDIALSTVSVVELTHGIYRAKTEADRERRRVFAEGAFQDLIVHPVTIEIAAWPGEPKASRLPTVSSLPSKTY
jgi:hypothetical protein